MATPEINENCHCVQNYPHRCKIKHEKFRFDILCCFGVIKKSLPGRAESAPPPGKIGLTLSHLGDLIHSQPGWGANSVPPP